VSQGELGIIGSKLDYFILEVGKSCASVRWIIGNIVSAMLCNLMQRRRQNKTKNAHPALTMRTNKGSLIFKMHTQQQHTTDGHHRGGCQLERWSKRENL
jgi:hypothetical protein